MKYLLSNNNSNNNSSSICVSSIKKVISSMIPGNVIVIKLALKQIFPGF